MTATEILARDLKLNHNNAIDLDLAATIIQHWRADGALLTRHGNTLYLSKRVAAGEVEFHTINADRAAALVDNTVEYLKSIRQAGANQVHTTYSNPKVTEIFKEITEKMGVIKCRIYENPADSTEQYQAVIEWGSK